MLQMLISGLYLQHGCIQSVFVPLNVGCCGFLGFSNMRNSLRCRSGIHSLFIARRGTLGSQSHYRKLYSSVQQYRWRHFAPSFIFTPSSKSSADVHIFDWLVTYCCLTLPAFTFLRNNSDNKRRISDCRCTLCELETLQTFPPSTGIRRVVAVF